MRLDERARAVELLRRHPGWGAPRIARLVGVSVSTVTRWRQEEGLAPALKRVGGRRRRVSLLGPSAVTLGEALARRIGRSSAA